MRHLGAKVTKLNVIIRSVLVTERKGWIFMIIASDLRIVLERFLLSRVYYSLLALSHQAFTSSFHADQRLR